MKKWLILPIALLFLSACSNAGAGNSSSESAFRGEKGTFVAFDNGVDLEADKISDGNAHFYNTVLPDGNTVYFFVVKSPDGHLRAAANGCQVCGKALQGFRQEGDFMVCNTCGNRYPMNKIATEKGGCNPAPINPDLSVEDGKIHLSTDELESILPFFG